LQGAFGLDGEVALVTGGGTGLGLGIASCLAAAGAKVVLVGRREAELAKGVAAIGGNAVYLARDITHFEGAPILIGDAERLAGAPISVLVNNAGIHLKKPAAETTTEQFQSVLATHLLAAHALNAAVLPGMLARSHGVILMTASMAAYMGVPLIIAYTAAKTACVGMTRALAAEVSGQGVRVNAIAPGWIESPMLREALAGDENRAQKILSRTPIGKFGRPEDIGWAAAYLCSPAAKFVTGVVLPVDGGASIGF
jgi:NAD(P)-dependent dehydrogenase (short-subunit alcohol dehydrogenase family)